MINVSNLSKSFATRRVLDAVTFIVHAGEVAGVVGPNGAGKTTLLRLIAGADSADRGSVHVGASLRAGYLRQGFAHDAGRATADVFPGAFADGAAGDRLASIAERLAREPDHAQAHALAGEYAEAVADLETVARGVDVPALWRELRLREVAPDERIETLSGGEQTKLGLIDVVASLPDVLLLDEPTNNLDLPALAWLDTYLDTFPGAVLIVSHDRALLDNHASVIIEIDSVSGRAETFDGGYESYASEKARRVADLWDRYRRQQERERRVRREIREIKQTALGREKVSQNDFYRGKAKKIARRGVVLERRLERELASSDKVEKPIKTPYRVKAEMSPTARAGDRMLFAGDLTLRIEGRELLRAATIEIGWGERAVLIGANGSGKTTLLRALIGERTPDAGLVRMSPSTHAAYLPQSEQDADPTNAITPVEVIRSASGVSETEARRFLHRFLFSGDDALTPVARLSYGERRRLSLARLVLSGANLLLLDEPTNHLDIPSREAFEAALDSYAGALLAVTHDRYFIERFAHRVISIEDGRLRTVMHADD